MFLARRKNSKRASTHLNYKRGGLTKNTDCPPRTAAAISQAAAAVQTKKQKAAEHHDDII